MEHSTQAGSGPTANKRKASGVSKVTPKKAKMEVTEESDDDVQFEEGF